MDTKVWFPKVVLLLLPVCVAFSNKAAAQRKDFRSWNDLSVEAALTDDLDIQAEVGLRLDKNASRWDENLYELELQYKGLDDYDISTGYRFSIGNEDHYAQYLHRWTLEGELEKDIDDWDLELELRTRLQTEFIPSEFDEDRIEHYLRDRLTISWKTDDFPVNPYLGFEHFVPLRKNRLVITDKNRYLAGADIDLDAGFELDISYRIQRHFDDIREIDYILSVSLSYEL